MTLPDIIRLAKSVESGGNPIFGFHLHESMRQATNMNWPCKHDGSSQRFSDFLRLLEIAETPDWNEGNESSK